MEGARHHIRNQPQHHTCVNSSSLKALRLPRPAGRRRVCTISSSCSMSTNAHQAAERRCSAQKCSTSYSGSGIAHGSTEMQHQQQGSRSCPEDPMCMERRGLLLTVASLSAALGLGAPHAQASKLPAAFDRAWEAVGGGPADLFFPEEFLGVWNVESVLSSVKLPLGPDFVPDARVVERAQKEDLNKLVNYHVAFIRNSQGRIVTDRRYNTLSLLDYYMGPGKLHKDDISWNPSDPNVLEMTLPGGLDILTRVTRRSETQQPPDRLDTSEYFEQIYASPGRQEPKVKASQCFTKYKWRDDAAALRDSGPQIVATQVVSDYLTPYDGELLMMRAQSNPVTVYTYRMRFWRDAQLGPKNA